MYLSLPFNECSPLDNACSSWTFDAVRRCAQGRLLERTAWQVVAGGECGVRALCSPIGDLDRAEELLLQALRTAFVKLLVGLAQGHQRESNRLRSERDGVQQLLSCLCVGVGHEASILASPRKTAQTVAVGRRPTPLPTSRASLSPIP